MSENEILKIRRKTWRPKLREASEQCASCPFRLGNDADFGAVVKRLCKKHGMPFTEESTLNARSKIIQDSASNGDFACHATVYGTDMKVKPIGEHRQCPGSTKWFRDGGESTEEVVS